jgi:outer membrane lipoprotein-sorting protein
VTLSARARIRSAAAAVAALAFTFVASAPADAALTAAQQRIVRRVEAYLNNIHTMTARFIQAEKNGWIAEGALYLQRPGKLRIEYAPPFRYVMVSTGKMLILYDGKTDEVTHLPMSVSPAAFLLDKKVDLSRNVEIVRVESKPNAYIITVSPRGSGSDKVGTLHLTFTRKPFAIKEWTVINAKHKEVRVVLVDPRFDVPIDPVKFLFERPGVARKKAPVTPGKVKRESLPAR